MQRRAEVAEQRLERRDAGADEGEVDFEKTTNPARAQSSDKEPPPPKKIHETSDAEDDAGKNKN